MPGEKSLTIYLTGWQKRMIADHMPAAHLKSPVEKITKLSLTDYIKMKKQMVMYLLPDTEKIVKGDWVLYLTDEQILHVKEVMGIRANISGLNISKQILDSGAVNLM